MIDPTVLNLLGTILVPITIALIGYFVSQLHKRINEVSTSANKRIDDMNIDLKAAQTREDAIRAEDRIDRHLDIIRTQMSERHLELLAAIEGIRGK